MSKILFICPYPPGRVPSQRFRFEQYLSQLNQKSFHVVTRPFFSEKAYTLYHSGKLLSKIHAITQSYFSRYLLFLHAIPFDFIFIHREATPGGPPIFEWILAKIVRKKIIYDFDDAIWLTDNKNECRAEKILRWRSKVGSICRWSYKISCGNEYLADYARQFNSRVVVNPTTIDTHHLYLTQREKKAVGKTTIGWTGSHSTLKYLEMIVPVLQAVEQKYPDIIFLIIADKDPLLPLKNIIFKPWAAASEISDLTTIDIGLMPLPDDPWARGKCGFKALQYMALEIPALVSPVGVNCEIVQHGVEGFLCHTPNEWFLNIEDLILNPKKRELMGQRGRRKVIGLYSVDANTDNFLSLFQ